MTTLFKILIFFRLVDSFDNTISLTNLATYVSLYRLLTVPNASYTEVGTVIAALATHTAKKLINNQKGTNDQANS